MPDNTLTALSESMQMYIVTIARLWRDNQPVPLSKLADSFSISPVSVNEMCRKLQDNGLVQYQPYKGASLTPAGVEKARYILRRHRLWEVFLVEKLGFEFEEAHKIACQLEHTTPDALADRLDLFLGFPSENPMGDPIPKPERAEPEVLSVALDRLFVGQQAQVTRVELDELSAQFLQKSGLRAGAQAVVMAVMEDGLLVQLNGKTTISLSHEIARTVFVSLIELQGAGPSGGAPTHQDWETEEEHKVNQADVKPVTEKTARRTPLNQMRVGQRGIVVRVRGKGQVRQRMMDMGLTPGSEIQVVRVAPLGDPIEFSLRGYHLSLRKTEACEIEVEVIE